MSPRLEHPRWCEPSRCEAHVGGVHQSEPVQVPFKAGRATQLLLSLVQAPMPRRAPRRGVPVRVRVIVIGDLIINSVDLSLDVTAMAAATMEKLVAISTGTEPPE